MAEQVKINVPSWFDAAACVIGPPPADATEEELADHDKDMAAAFPATVEKAREFIRRNCSWCPVKAECGEYAERLGVKHGVWGGKLYGRDYLADADPDAEYNAPRDFS